jgi:hypothetical protein
MQRISRGFCCLVFSSVPCVLCLPLFAQTAGTAASEKSALLIGINTYQPLGTHPVSAAAAGAEPEGRFAVGLDFENLKGPLNDVKAMRALLTSAKFGFPDDPQHMHLLLDTDATRAAVLTALDTYVANATPGSIVVVYVASHGSLRINDQGAGQVYMLDGEQHHLDGTIVPADPYLGKDDITSYELRTVFMNAAKRGVHVTAIFDSCHSGGPARGADSKLVKRSLAWDPRPILNQSADRLADRTLAPGPEDLPDNPVLVLSAAQKDQSAVEDDRGIPHGRFTTALIEALQALPAGAKASDVFERVQVNLEIAGASDQQLRWTPPPSADGSRYSAAQRRMARCARRWCLQAMTVFCSTLERAARLRRRTLCARSGSRRRGLLATRPRLL